MSAVETSVAVSVRGLGKAYPLFERPLDRLLEAFAGRWKRFSTEFWALRDVSFDVARGEVLGVLGRNGSGKSTLLQLLAGVLQPSQGEAVLRGRLAAILELGSGFNPDFTGRENVYLNAALLGLGRREIDERFPEIAAFAGIGEFLDQPVRTYSTGMWVRLAFAVSVHVDADVLLVDEALSVGDAGFQFRCLEHVERLRELGKTIVLVSHDLQLIKSNCDRALYLRRGVLEFEGDCEEATERYSHELKSEQSRTPLHARAPLENRPGLRFGSARGRFDEVVVGGESGPCHVFTAGGPAWIEVAATIGPDVRHPRIFVILRDSRGYNVYGLDTRRAGCDPIPDGEGRIRVRLRFRCGLAAGSYFVTTRLEDSRGDSVAEVLDKQVSAASFEVVFGRTSFWGVADLDGSFEAVPADSTPE